jgi:GT2 family glycosyltransferase
VRLGILNVIYNSDGDDLQYFYGAVQREAERALVTVRNYVFDNTAEPSRIELPPNTTYQHSATNLGYTAATNHLMAAAFADGCDAVITMNADGFPLPGCIEKLVGRYEALGRNALIEARQFPEEHPKVYDPVTGDSDWVSGCCMLIGREVYDRLGSFDENLFLYCEDVDYSFRARQNGVRCVTVDDALFFHPVRNRPAAPSRRRLALVSGRYFAAKWGNDQARDLFSQALVEEGHFGSPDMLPALPEDMQEQSGQISFDASHRLTFARGRWSV